MRIVFFTFKRLSDLFFKCMTLTYLRFGSQSPTHVTFDGPSNSYPSSFLG